MFDNLKQSFYPTNTTLNWIETDTKDLFDVNLKKFKNNESLEYYLKNPIEYKFNNFGYRTPDDFNNVDSGNVFLGCSHTMGVGLHLENVWSYRLNQHIGGKFWNISVGGIGIMTNFRLLLAFHKDLKIKNIFHYVPKYPRYEFYVNGKFKTFNMSYINDVNYLELLGDLYQVELIHTPYIMAINQLAQEIGCNYYVINNIKTPNRKNQSIESRDLFHFSIEQHDEIYNKFLDKFNRKDVMKNNFEKSLL